MNWALWTGLGLFYLLMGCGVVYMRGARPRYLHVVPLTLALLWPLIVVVQAYYWFTAADEPAGWPEGLDWWRYVRGIRHFEDLACRECGKQVCVEPDCDADSHICGDCKEKLRIENGLEEETDEPKN